MIAGRTTVGSTPFALDADTKRVARFRMPVAANVAKASLYLDGQGGGVQPQACKAVIYDLSDNLVAVSDEVIVAPGLSPGWVDFAFSAYGGGVAIPVSDFYAGLIVGAYTDVIRVYGDDPHGSGGKTNADTYADGPDSPFGAADPLTADLSFYLSCFTPYVQVRPVLPDIYYGRLPFKDAQAVLGLGGPDQKVGLRLVNVGWHGAFTDPELGSVALVRDGSDLADVLLGERVRVTTTDAIPRSVAAYVHNTGDANLIDWDLSLPRHLFARIGELAADTIPCVVEVLG